ncbi:hypothetical protein CEUSTIGMA_g10361.t1 [Chlamydomonas eustigma]|uniref:Uncharacterized protein n=1 Tax=Chlamydomonas eustigma TaxID=1157962 RepID=A0A250XIN1_9CHLO|nr:hypothetical protein CEUSTIGMA_g10361.t1 [Chlamydomonas eustigma]|eukprot:GAX82934.1 hypothetical protein CEUSTIGMA_g10361.t1 [Chlamydomonas eustigma]
MPPTDPAQSCPGPAIEHNNHTAITFNTANTAVVTLDNAQHPILPQQLIQHPHSDLRDKGTVLSSVISSSPQDVSSTQLGVHTNSKPCLPQDPNSTNSYVVSIAADTSNNDDCPVSADPIGQDPTLTLLS